MANIPFKFEHPENSPGLLLWQTTVIWQRQIKQVLEPHELAHAQFVILAVLLWLTETEQAPTQVMIARLTKLDKMTVSKSLKKLALLGYVTRNEHASDTRAKTVHLTATGKALVSGLIPQVEALDAKFFAVLNGSEQKHLNQYFEKLIGEE